MASLSYKTWKTNHQIFLISILAGFTTLFIGLAVIVPAMKMYQHVQQSINYSVFIQETQNNLLQYMQLQMRRVRSSFDAASLEVRKIDGIYQFVLQNQIQFYQQAQDCLNNGKNKDIYAFKSSFCFMNLTQVQQKSFIDLSSLLTITLQIFNFQHLTYFTNIANDSYFSEFPGDDLEGYEPHQRPWFKNYMNSQNQTKYNVKVGEPVLDQDGFAYVGVYSNLNQQNKTRNGVIGVSLYFQDCGAFLRNGEVQINIINSKGLVICSGVHHQNNNNFDTIYTQPVSGFNYDQWAIMQQNRNTRGYAEYNLNYSDIYIIIRKLQYPDFYIVLYQSDSLIQIKNKQSVELLSGLIQKYTINIIIYGSILMILIFIIQIIMIKIVIQPITTIIDLINYNCYQDSQFKSIISLKRAKINQYHSASQNDLVLSFQQMIKYNLENPERKNEICEYHQSIQFPMYSIDKKQIYKKTNLIRRSIKYIHDLDIIFQQSSYD